MEELIHELVHNTHSSVLDYDPATEAILKQISVIREACRHDHVHDKFYAMKMLENDEVIVRDLRMSKAQLNELESLQKQFCAQRGQREIDMAVADMRYALIEAMMKQCVKKSDSETSVSRPHRHDRHQQVFGDSGFLSDLIFNVHRDLRPDRRRAEGLG